MHPVLSDWGKFPGLVAGESGAAGSLAADGKRRAGYFGRTRRDLVFGPSELQTAEGQANGARAEARDYTRSVGGAVSSV